MRLQSYVLSKNNNFYSNIIRHIMCALFIFSFSNIATIYSVLPVSWDECGYMGQAKLLAGYNWSNVISQMPYYSYGCGMIPSLIMRFGLPYNIEYRLVLIINSLLLVGIYYLSIFLIKNLYSGISGIEASLIALIMACYPSNIAFSDFLLSENYLTFCFYLASTFLVNYLKTKKYKYIFICAGLVASMFYIHNRAIAVIVALFVFILFSFFLNKQIKQMLIILGMVSITVVLLWLGWKYKIDAQNSLWTVKNDLNSINDIGAVVPSKMLKDLLDIKKLGLRITLASGKIWYLLVSTFGIFAVGIYYEFKWACSFLKKQCSIQGEYALFLLISFIGTCGVFLLLSYSVERIDHIIIGRYLDYMIGPFIMVGLCEFNNNRKKESGHIFLMAAFVIIIIGKIIERTADYYIEVGDNIFDPLSNAEWGFMWGDYYKRGTFMIIAVISFLIILLFIKLLSIKKRAIIITCLVFNVITAVFYHNMIIKIQKKDNYPLVKMAELIEADEVVGYIPVDTGAVKIKYLLTNNEIIPIYDINEMNSDNYDYIFSSRPIENDIIKGFSIVYESKSGYLYKNNT